MSVLRERPHCSPKVPSLKGIWCTCSLSTQGTNYLPPEKWNSAYCWTELDKKDAEIAEMKAPDLNAHDPEAAARSVAGTARSMGLDVVEG